MDLIKIYEDFEETSSEEMQKELLEEFIEDRETNNFVYRFLRGRGMSLDEIECVEHDQFFIRYSPHGESIPPRISYYIDDLKELLGEMMGTDLSWSFGTGPGFQGVGTLIFTLDEEIDPKLIKAKRIMRDF